MKNNSTWILLCLACMMTLSCSDKKNTADESEKGVSTVLPDTKNEVAVQILKKRDFHHELMSNGKISARGKADLRFETGEVIAHIYVKNGDRVQKGQKLADLDKFRLEQKLSQSEDALLKAELELKDVLIGQGYSSDCDFTAVRLVRASCCFFFISFWKRRKLPIQSTGSCSSMASRRR